MDYMPVLSWKVRFLVQAESVRENSLTLTRCCRSDTREPLPSDNLGAARP